MQTRKILAYIWQCVQIKIELIAVLTVYIAYTTVCLYLC